MTVPRQSPYDSRSPALHQPAFEGTLEDGLAQARGAFERAFDFGFGLRDVGKLGFDLGDDFGLFVEALVTNPVTEIDDLAFLYP